MEESLIASEETSLTQPPKEKWVIDLSHKFTCGQTFFKGAWKYENEPRVMFMVHALKTPAHPYGVKTLVGVPESLVGQPKKEERWIRYDLGGATVRLKYWRLWVLPELRRKRLLLR